MTRKPIILQKSPIHEHISTSKFFMGILEHQIDYLEWSYLKWVLKVSLNLSDNAENSIRYHDDDELFRQRSKVGHKIPGLNVT